MTDKNRIPTEDFVKRWERSRSLDEAATLCKTTKVKAAARAAQLRWHGVPLKRFRANHERLDVGALSALCKKGGAK